MEDKAKAYDIVAEIFERRELSPCWIDGEAGDCGNWPHCDGGCPLVELRQMVDMEPREDGSVPKNPHRN